jgi:hypothetical protein
MTKATPKRPKHAPNRAKRGAIGPFSLRKNAHKAVPHSGHRAEEGGGGRRIAAPESVAAAWCVAVTRRRGRRILYSDPDQDRRRQPEIEELPPN